MPAGAWWGVLGVLWKVPWVLGSGEALQLLRPGPAQGRLGGKGPAPLKSLEAWAWQSRAPFSDPSKAAVRAVQAMNRICVLDVDLQGVRNIKKTDLRPIYISVQPPSLDVLVGARGRAGQAPWRSDSDSTWA